MRRSLPFLLLAIAACGGDGADSTVVVVTLDALPGVPPTGEVTVTVRNGNDMVARMFMAQPVTFPSTFSVTPHDRTGALAVDAEASGSDGRTAHGASQVNIVPAGRADLHVTLVPDDYVLNSRRAGAQVTSFGLGARQLASAADGSFSVIYEDTCPQLGRCDIWSRLFDAGGAPRTNSISQDTTDFIVNVSPVGTLTRPTIAQLKRGGLLGGWKSLDAPVDLRIRVFDHDGTPLGPGEQSVLATTAFDREPDNLMAAALDENRFLVVWQQERSSMPAGQPLYIHARVVTSDGTLLGEFQVNADNPPPGNQHANDDHVTPYAIVAADGSFVVTWVRGSASCVDTLTTGPCEMRARWFDASGNQGPETSVPSTPSMLSIEPVGAATGDGFLFVWADKFTSGPDSSDYSIVARKFDRSGAPIWPNQEVLDTSTAGPQGNPAVASTPDAQLLAVWTDCSMAGIDMDSCGIRGRSLQPFGLPIGDDFEINTTTQGGQGNASVAWLAGTTFFAAWADSSVQPPDIDGAVRGRFVTPAFDRTDGVSGAACDVDHACGNNLVCTPHGSGSFCHVVCTQVGQPCDSGGVCQASTGPGGGTSCQFP